LRNRRSEFCRVARKLGAANSLSGTTTSPEGLAAGAAWPAKARTTGRETTCGRLTVGVGGEEGRARVSRGQKTITTATPMQLTGGRELTSCECDSSQPIHCVNLLLIQFYWKWFRVRVSVLRYRTTAQFSIS